MITKFLGHGCHDAQDSLAVQKRALKKISAVTAMICAMAAAAVEFVMMITGFQGDQ